jgi:hypothetical protein
MGSLHVSANNGCSFWPRFCIWIFKDVIINRKYGKIFNQIWLLRKGNLLKPYIREQKRKVVFYSKWEWKRQRVVILFSWLMSLQLWQWHLHKATQRTYRALYSTHYAWTRGALHRRKRNLFCVISPPQNSHILWNAYVDQLFFSILQNISNNNYTFKRLTFF